MCTRVWLLCQKYKKCFFSGSSGQITLIMQQGHFFVFTSRSLCYKYIDHPVLGSRSTNNDTEQCVLTSIEVQENQFPQVNIEFLKVNYELQPKFHIKLSSNIQFLRLPNCQIIGLLYITAEDYYLTTLGKSCVPIFSHSDSVSHLAIKLGMLKETINNTSQSDLQHSRYLICVSPELNTGELLIHQTSRGSRRKLKAHIMWILLFFVQGLLIFADSGINFFYLYVCHWIQRQRTQTRTTLKWFCHSTSCRLTPRRLQSRLFLTFVVL